MRFVLLIFLAHFNSIAFASQDLNHIACVYYHDGAKWVWWSSSYSASPFNLTDGEKRLLSGGWTSEKPAPPNYAYCTDMIGTSSDDVVIIETYRYQADRFFGSGPNNDCSISGWNVELLTKERHQVARGSFAELEIDWIPPEAQRVRVREYFPMKSELATIHKISAKKCAELLPRQ